MYDWRWIITSRGDSGILGKQYVQTIQAEDRTAKQNHGEHMLVSTFDSSIVADEVFAKITQLHGQEWVDEGDDIEKFAEVDIDPNTGALRNADGIPVYVISEDCGTDSQAQLSAKPLGRGARIKFPNCKLTCGTSEDIINDFQCHLESKYQVTSNTNGVYLGIHMTPLADSSGSYCFTKPTQ